MRKFLKLILSFTIFSVIVFTAASCSTKCNHVWKDATCTSAKTCTVCNAVRGEALGHSGGEASCLAKATCERCGEEYGEKPDHIWVEASCEMAKHCEVCLQEEGEALGHTGGTATCVDKAVCERCQKEYGTVDFSNHLDRYQYVKTATTHRDHCNCCGNDIGDEEPHSFVNGTCEVCGYTPTVAVSDAQAQAGEAVTLSVSLTDTVGIAGLQITVRFDPSRFTLASVEQGEIFEDFIFTASSNLANGSVFMWDGAAESVENGELLSLTFNVGDGISAGDYVVEITVSAYDVEMNEISLKIVNGKITVA